MEFTRPRDLLHPNYSGCSGSRRLLSLVRPHERDDRARGDACDCARPELRGGTYSSAAAFSFYTLIPEVRMGLLSWWFSVDPKDVAQIDSPAAAFDKPSDVVHDTSLGPQEKRAALDTWERDARQLMTASNEGMPGPQEGLEPMTITAWQRLSVQSGH
jgi:hypothetical protein